MNVCMVACVLAQPHRTASMAQRLNGPLKSELLYTFTALHLCEQIKNQTLKDYFNLLVVGISTHDGRVDDAAEHHGQWVDGQRAVAGLLLHQVAQLFIGHLHGLDGVLQRTDLLLNVGTTEGM